MTTANDRRMKNIHCKLLVIGAGPGGYVCAIKASQLGVETVIIEQAELGGTCLNVGCIPSKALIHAADEFYKITEVVSGNSKIGISAQAPQLDFSKTTSWKDDIVDRLNSGVDGLLRQAGVTSVQGHAKFLDGKRVEVKTPGGVQIINAEMIVIATGSETIELPFLKFGGNIISSTEALALDEVPNKLTVVGGGYIGLELGTAFAKLGSNVTVIEADEKILPQYDAELTKPLAARLKHLDVKVLTSTKVKGLSSDKSKLVIETLGQAEQEIDTDKILVTVGRKPVTNNVGLDQLVLNMAGAFIEIDDKCRTSMKGIFAIGDVTGEPMLAHRAMAQGEMVAEIVAGKNRSWDKYCIPAVCFTDPEIVTAGITPLEAEQAGIAIKISNFPFKANGRAMTTEREDGFIRVIARADNHLILGVQGIGANISELSASLGLAIEMGARLEDIATTIHAHPTLGEALQEACLKALGNAIHI